MARTGWRWSVILSKRVVALLSVAALAALAWTIARRVGYPYHLEYLEGGMVDAVERVARGKALYTPPSIDHASFLYPPLYYWVAAAVGRVAEGLGVGRVGFVTARCVSIISTLSCLALLGFLSEKLARPCRQAWFVRLTAAGFFAASYRASGAWMDLARVDMLALALLLGSVAALARAKDWPGGIAAGALLALAAMAKTTMLVVAAPLAIWLSVAAWAALREDEQEGRARARVAVAWLTAACVGVGGSTAILDAASGDWYSFYAWQLPAQHAWVPRAGLAFLSTRVLGECWPFVALAVAGLVAAGSARREKQPVERTEPDGVRLAPMLGSCLVLGAGGAAYLGMAHVGGDVNALLPFHATLALLAAPVVAAPRRPWHGMVAAGLAFAQFSLFKADPRTLVPTAADRAAGDALAARMASGELGREPYVPAFGHLTTLADLPAHAPKMALDDVARGRDADAQARVFASLERAMREARFTAIVGFPYWHPQLAEKWYARRGPAVAGPNAFFPPTGYHVRPEWIYLRRDLFVTGDGASSVDALGAARP